MKIEYIEELNNLEFELIPYKEINPEYNLDKIIFDLDSEIDILSSKADSLDYIVSLSSGLMCGMLDVLWVGEFDLKRGREISSEKINNFVMKMAKMNGYKEADNIKGAVKFLENTFPIPSDANERFYGGGTKHHLRDFAHHPTIVGLAFSLLTQFTNKSYGTDKNGVLLIIDIPEKSKKFIGKNVAEKIMIGSITWFFHLVSDMAGSRSTAGKTGGTGIPGPILSLAKELSALPIFRDKKIGDYSISNFLSKLFDGTLLGKGENTNSAYKFDLRGELGVAEELKKQAIPVIANECIVRSFYFIRHLAYEIKENQIASIEDMIKIEWKTVKPTDNPTIARMLTIATGVFTMVDVSDSIITQKYWISVNYVGVGRFAIAIGTDVTWCLKARDVKKIRKMYEKIKKNTYREVDDNIYKRIGENMKNNEFGLNLEQTEILFNIEYYKTLNDIEKTKSLVKNEETKALKKEWLLEWRKYMTEGFSSFLNIEDAELHWYTPTELNENI